VDTVLGMWITLLQSFIYRVIQSSGTILKGVVGEIICSSKCR
jgi:hypothetical protein